MKKVLTLILVIMISITIYSEKVLKVVGDISYPPFSFPDKKPTAGNTSPLWGE